MREEAVRTPTVWPSAIHLPINGEEKKDVLLGPPHLWGGGTGACDGGRGFCFAESMPLPSFWLRRTPFRQSLKCHLPHKWGRRRKAVTATAIALIASLQIAAAVAPHEAMQDADQDRRARALYSEVRCVVCQNEAIADSSADIAADLRADIRGQIREGRSDTQIRETLVERYGDFVLFRPRLTATNLILWASPFIVLMLGGVAFFHLTRRKVVTEDTAPADLNDEEALRLRDRLSDPTSESRD